MKHAARPQVTSIATSCRHEGEPIEQCRLSAGGIYLELITLGCAITRLEVPDSQGHCSNVVLGHADIARYAAGREYFGAVIGRLANRLRDSRLRLDGTEYLLSANDGPHHLHGGACGFDRRLWRLVAACVETDRAVAQLERISAAGEEGYPGELQVTVRYAVTAGGDVETELSATAQRPTIVNLTNHSYFNLRGEGEGDIGGHELTIHADRYCVIDADLLPTGELRCVADTAFDFRRPRPVGQGLLAADPQLQLAGGYDHCMALTAGGRAGSLALACLLHDPVSGRRMEVWTDQPGVQFYTGNFLDGSTVGPSGRRYRRHGGLCLETQRFPDAPNRPEFPSVRLEPGQTYESRTIWRFKT
jgi:aldose 1-epimerase